MKRKNLLIVLAVALIAGGYWLYDRFGSAHLSISSEPAGAMVRIDRRQVGLTPLDVSVSAGRHMLEVQHSHYVVYARTVDVGLGERLAEAVVLQPGPGTLNLLSNPKGAWVEVNGERLDAVTPTRFETTSGEIVVRMGQPERRGVEKTVTLNAGALLDVQLDLNIDPHGSLTVSVKPRDAKIELPLDELAYEPGVRLPIGEHLIRISRRGYVTQEFRHKVVYGDSLAQVTLERDYGALTVAVTPADAEITVRYRQGRRWRPEPYRPGMKLPVGDVEVRARSMGYRTGFSEFYLTNTGHKASFRLSTVDIEPGSVFADDLADGGEGPQLVVIPAGSFAMGDASGPPSEQPEREVTITQPFALSVNEVSIREFRRFADATGLALNKRLDDVEDSEPMRYVSWDHASEYAEWLSRQSKAKYRLPTEAEWEYAARAGGAGAYFFGDDPLGLCTYANLADRSTRRRFREWKTLACDDGHEKVAPVGSLQANAFGLHDVYGNVGEWVEECGMPDYANAPDDGSEARGAMSCDTHGYRGGSWDSQPEELRSAYRNTGHGANDDRGIRLLREL